MGITENGAQEGGYLNQILSGGNTPQQQGYGIGHPAAYEPYQSAPGLQQAADPNEGFRFGQMRPGGGDLARSPQGLDQLSPGVGEQYFNNQQNRFQSGGMGEDFFMASGQNYAQPGAGEQYWNSLSGKNAPQYGEGVFRQASGDFQGPSSTETFARGALPQVAGPSQSEQFYGQSLGKLQSGVGTQNAQDAYASFVASNPSAGLDPYYDRASEKVIQDNNRALAASGMLGSSVGANNTTDALVGLRAEQANREGEFGLQSAQLRGQLAQGADQGGLEGVRLGGQLAANASNAELGRLGLGGNLAGNIDQQNLAQYGMLGNLGMGLDSQDLARDMGYGNLALGAQGAGMSRLGQGQQTAMGLDAFDLQQAVAGMGAASAAQQMQQGRGQSMLDNMYRQQQAGVAAAQPYYQGAIESDQALMDSTMAAELGLGQLAATQGYRNQERHKEDAKWGMEMAGQGASMMGGK